MVLTALRGALGFLSRLPVGADERAWEAFRATPAAFPLAGYVVGALAALPLVTSPLVSLPAPTVALAYVAAVYLVAGVAHADGLADCGDAAVVHGGHEERRAVLKDTAVGVGGALAVGVVLLGLGFAGLALAGLPVAAAVGLAVAAEVAAKLGMAAVACLGTATHEGLGSQLTAGATPGHLLGPALVALPAAVLTWPASAAAAALAGGLAAALVVLAWARARLGGASGDVFGASNELARVVALHTGVVVWAGP